MTLYSKAYFQGTSLTFYGSVPDLYEYDFTKLTKSIIVHEGVWLFYQTEEYGEKVLVDEYTTEPCRCFR